MGIEMRAGRPFAIQDGARAPRVAIINEAIARRFFRNENPVGHRLVMEPTPRTIVGVVSDTRHFGLDQEIHPEVYLPYTQPFLQDPKYLTYLTLAVRAASNQTHPTSPSSLARLAATIRNQVRAIEPNEPVNQVITMDERLSNSVAGRRFQMLLLGAFAAVALVIATVGIYGVISYSVNQRTREIGIRMALGAPVSSVLWMVVWRGMNITLIGVALGLVAAIGMTRVMKSLLFNVSATDPMTFTIIVLLLIGVALIASFIPARRATKVNPIAVLKIE
jgi:predicted permease